MYTDYRLNDENLIDYQKYEQIILTISKRFMTYGYTRIQTPMFEQYDLYTKVTSSIHQNEMMKVIDGTGQVLVLRPDVTIPITRQLAAGISELRNEYRYFYVQDVFRQTFDGQGNSQRTQAGVEYFGVSSPEADAEVIALSCQTVTDLGLQDCKIEIGHAGFFNELISEMNLTATQVKMLTKMIQAKNVTEIESFILDLPIGEKVKKAIMMIPFLYGKPEEVQYRAAEIAFTPNLKNKLEHLAKVVELLKLYGLEDYLVLDLGLINHMGYYSGIIFQGFVEHIGKPVLMGGRYDQLGNEFEAEIPAIGFACEIDSLIEASANRLVESPIQLDAKIIYDSACISQSIQLANELRDQNYRVLSLPSQKKVFNHQQSTCTIYLEEASHSLLYQEKKTPFVNSSEVVRLLEEERGTYNCVL
ncbi:ATP phosphoribosyltransferase regulatory subunit [Filibacter tadaridae]|uniref:ATP phosphoribosyltransferase regulatory subunit n=1 Tax=Filibacter tadaridae TaxID=2483811 RepID=A0A3P5XT48_9BACL|nr:ATP phosphoribosyltransferase regulatory subunit [Filibacter tadaridae]VDC33549.1 ATP phosphoribosyltransferase regulatory subunit [Filibacter tadaridae]